MIPPQTNGPMAPSAICRRSFRRDVSKLMSRSEYGFGDACQRIWRTEVQEGSGPRRRPRVLVDAKPPCVDSRGRGCARPASEGSLDESYRRALILTHRRYRAATAAPRAHAREAKGADAPARRLRAALMSHHQGPMVSLSWLASKDIDDGTVAPTRHSRLDRVGIAVSVTSGKMTDSAGRLIGSKL